MNSDYRYLMLSGYGSYDLCRELIVLTDYTEQVNIFQPYSTSEENAIYKATKLDYIDKIYSMNINYESENDSLRLKLDEVANAVSEEVAKHINEQL